MSASPDAGPDIDADADSDTDIDVGVDVDVDISTANTMRERTNENRFKFWLLLSANRLFVTGLLGAVVFVASVVIGVAVYPPFPSSAAGSDVIETMFSTMIGAIITAATLVVTIGQLVISQENGPLGEQRNRMSNTMDYRTYAQEMVGQPMPADPSAFLRSLVKAVDRRSGALREAISGNDNDQLRAEVDEFTQSTMGNADTVRDNLDGAQFGSFNVLLAALNFNYGWNIFQVERITDDHADSLSAEDQAILDELRTALSMFGPAREHVKTLFFEWELINLSQLIMYVSVPALVVAGSMLAFVSELTFSGATFGVPDLLWVVAGAFTVTLLPFLLLVSYVVRVATVAKRTLAIGPLILRRSQR